MRSFCSLALAASLTACASNSYWLYPPGGTEAQWHQDVYACTQESQQSSSSAYVNPYGGAAQSGSSTNYELRDACMRAKGYREGTPPNQQRLPPISANEVRPCAWIKDLAAGVQRKRTHPHATKLIVGGVAKECRNTVWTELESYEPRAGIPTAEQVEK